METTILEISGDGLEISLMDGSTWSLRNLGDCTKTVCWYATQRIKIKDNDDGTCTLTNLDTAAPDKIKAARAF